MKLGRKKRMKRKRKKSLVGMNVTGERQSIKKHPNKKTPNIGTVGTKRD